MGNSDRKEVKLPNNNASKKRKRTSTNVQGKTRKEKPMREELCIVFKGEPLRAAGG